MLKLKGKVMHKEEKNNNIKNIVFCCLCLVIALVAIAALVVIKNSSGDSFTPSGTVGAVDNLSIFPTKDSMAQEFFDADTFIGETDDEELDINEDGRAEDFSNLESSDGGESADNISTDPNTRIAGSSLTYSNGCWHKKGSSKCYTGWATNFNAKGCTAYLVMGVKKQGWLSYGGNYYYLSKAPGWVGCRLENTQKEINKRMYLFGKNGKMWTGWSWDNDRYYYYNSSGAMVAGSQNIGGKYYYFGPKNNSYSDHYLRCGWQIINNKKYYYGKDKPNYMYCYKNTGWKTIENDVYYFGNNGVMRTGWEWINNKKYYFGNNGIARTGWQTINHKRYYFGKKNNNTLYNDSYFARIGLQTISKKKYYFNSEGVMQTGLKLLGNKRYYFDTDGAAITGWKTVPSTGKRYYFGSDYVAYSGGWKWIKENRQYCYFNNDATLDRCKK